MQADNDEERVVGLHTWSPKGQALNKHPSTCNNSDLFAGWRVADEIAKPQVSINSNNSSNDCKKPATANGICNRKY